MKSLFLVLPLLFVVGCARCAAEERVFKCSYACESNGGTDAITYIFKIWGKENEGRGKFHCNCADGTTVRVP